VYVCDTNFFITRPEKFLVGFNTYIVTMKYSTRPKVELNPSSQRPHVICHAISKEVWKGFLSQSKIRLNIF